MSEHARHVEPLIDTDQAAHILGISKRTLMDLVADGRVPSYKIGSARRYRASELEQFIQAHAQGERAKIATVTPLKGRRR